MWKAIGFSQPEGSNADSPTLQLANFLNNNNTQVFEIVEREDGYITIIYQE